MTQGKLQEAVSNICGEMVTRIDHLNPGMDNTNDIYYFYTQKSAYILKITKDMHTNRTPFWEGLHLLFGKTVEDAIDSQHDISTFIKELNLIRTPQIFKSDPRTDNPFGAPYVIMEKMTGEPVPPDSELADEVGQDPDIAYQLGAFLSSIHHDRYPYFGNLSGEQYALHTFPERLAKTIKQLSLRPNAKQNAALQKLLPEYIEMANNMIAPSYCGIIMLDLWPSQFLVTKPNVGELKLSALIDLESYVIGPIGLEFALLELWMGQLGKFKEGYFEIQNEWEDFEDNRDLYRFFLYLLYDCPPKGLDACLDSRAKFPQGDRIKSRLQVPRPRPPGSPSNPTNPWEH